MTKMISRRLLYVQYTDPAAYPPIEHSSRLFAERGWRVVLLGTGSAGNLDLRLPEHPRILVKNLGFVKGGLRQKLHYAAFLVWTLYWTWRWRPHWVYASDPLVCPVAWAVKRLLNVRVVYHEHDSPGGGQAHTWFMRQVGAYRARLGREAELCVLPQQQRLQQFLETTGRKKRTFCVWNCPRLEEIKMIADCRLDQGGELILYYHGSINRPRLPEQLIVAASRFKGAVRLQIAGYEAPDSIGYIKQLIRLAGKNGEPELIEALGTIPRCGNLMATAASAHVGLSLMPRRSQDINLQHMVGASNKAFDYMACGLPLLVTDLAEWVSTFVEPGYGRACNPADPDTIEAALRWYLDHPAERREMGHRCQEKVRREWNYDATFAGVLAEMEHD